MARYSAGLCAARAPRGQLGFRFAQQKAGGGFPDLHP